MLISFTRTIITYFLVVIAIRIMGKRQVGQLEPTELVITLMISDLATIPLGHVSIPLLYGVIPILTLVIIEATLSFLNLKNRRIRQLFSGTPMILIENGEVCEEKLKKTRLNFDDLSEMLRIQGATDVKDIKYGILETSGSLSVMLKEKDDKKSQDNDSFPFFFICDGEINYRALEIFKKNTTWLFKNLNNNNVSDILLAGIDKDGNFYMQLKEKK